MKKFKVQVSRFLLAVMVVMQIFGVGELPKVHAAEMKNLESIIVSGGYFNTGLMINQDYSIEMVFSLSDLTQYKDIYVAAGSKYPVYKLRSEASRGLFGYHGWYSSNAYVPKVNEELKISQKKNITYVNGIQRLKMTYQSLSATSNLLFGDLRGSIKSFKVWNPSNILVADYVPVIDANGRACMYDKVNGKLRYYSGTCKAGKIIEDSSKDDTEVEKPSADDTVNKTPDSEDKTENTGSISGSDNSDVKYAEALKLSGGYFNTGLKINQDYSLEMVFSMDDLTQYKDLYLAPGEKYPVYKLRSEAGNGLVAYHGWYSTKIYTPKPATDIKISQKKNITYINDKQVLKMTYQTITSTGSLTFGNLKGTIKSFKVWNGSGKLVSDCVPAINTDNKACMYDKVTGKYLKYSGTCTAIVKESENEEDKTPSDSDSDKPVVDTVKEAHDAIYGILKEVLIKNSSEKKSIYKYGMKTEEVEKIWEEVKADYPLEYHASACVYPFINVRERKADYIILMNTDSQYQTRLEKLRIIRDNFVKSVDASMSDADKVLLAHELVVNKVNYVHCGTIGSSAGNALVNGEAVCGGYSRAMAFLLQSVDVETEIITSSQMNHRWLLIKVDGEWYQSDTTWDDTRKSGDGTGFHRYLLRSDAEFLTISAGTHYSWKVDSGKPITCTSNKYSKWYVHDVAGSMYYYNGLWYYFDKATATIKAADINGNNMQTVISRSEVSGISGILGISNGVLRYSANGRSYSKTL